MRVGHPATSDWPTPRPPCKHETAFASTRCVLLSHSLCLWLFFSSCDWTRGFGPVCHTIKACGAGWLMIDHDQRPVVFCVAPSARVCHRPRDLPLVYQPFYELPGFQASLSLVVGCLRRSISKQTSRLSAWRLYEARSLGLPWRQRGDQWQGVRPSPATRSFVIDRWQS
jgi:hypothetical protein